MQELKPIVFKISGKNFGVDIDVVSSIENMIEIFPAPNSPDYIKGIVNLRGEVIPLYSLKKKFNMEDKPKIDGEENKIIVVRIGEFSLALEVDSVENIKDVDAGKVFDTPLIIQTDKTKYLHKIANIDNQLIMIINPVELLEEHEKMAIMEMINKNSEK